MWVANYVHCQLYEGEYSYRGGWTVVVVFCRFNLKSLLEVINPITRLSIHYPRMFFPYSREVVK